MDAVPENHCNERPPPGRARVVVRFRVSQLLASLTGDLSLLWLAPPNLVAPAGKDYDEDGIIVCGARRAKRRYGEGFGGQFSFRATMV